MRFLSALLLVTALAMFGHGAASAQTETPPVFDSYEDMRGTLDDLMSKRQIADLLTAFGGGDEMSFQDMTGLETQVRNVFPDDFENAATMMRQEMENGFSQELIAYWTGISYIYARVLWHQLPSGEVVSIKLLFNSDPDELIPLF
jgi:hypothetical protein